MVGQVRERGRPFVATCSGMHIFRGVQIYTVVDRMRILADLWSCLEELDRKWVHARIAQKVFTLSCVLIASARAHLLSERSIEVAVEDHKLQGKGLCKKNAQNLSLAVARRNWALLACSFLIKMFLRELQYLVPWLIFDGEQQALLIVKRPPAHSSSKPGGNCLGTLSSP